MINPDAAYRTHEKQIHEQVNYLSRRMGLDPLECLSYTHQLFMRACVNYDPNQGASFYTYLHNSIERGLKNLIPKTPLLSLDYETEDSPAIRATIPDPSADFEQEFSLMQYIEYHCTEDEITIAQAFFDGEFSPPAGAWGKYTYIYTPRIIQQRWGKDYGWTAKRTKKAWEGLAEKLRGYVK